jgi:hypothetical protein
MSKSDKMVFNMSGARAALIALIAVLPSLPGCSRGGDAKTGGRNGILVLRQDTATSMYAYYDEAGKKVLGDYAAAFTDTMRDYAIVADSDFVLIDRQGRYVYHIFPYDNGPDYASDGYYRIVENGKIGYVDSASARLAIKPAYDCAYPFENGRAKVSVNCRTVSDGEHSGWKSEEWFFIDKQGRRLQ